MSTFSLYRFQISKWDRELVRRVQEPEVQGRPLNRGEIGGQLDLPGAPQRREAGAVIHPDIIS
ncbi:MAG TPA: hypothetical protein VMV49_06760, partial [Candidatus Deferrimicrobium sp.]|nr:hypothetical protein [Candidatus Deferrimicrobium sp.]